MDNALIERWNDRYKSEEFAYGTAPNNFLKENIVNLNVGSILFPAEGEGRNAVYAATLGWNVSAFDLSHEGKKKAMQLANAHSVTIDYQVGELITLTYQPLQFDAVALIYAHFPTALKSHMHKSINKFLKIGGNIIFEAFSKNHIDYVLKNDKVGGPKEVGMLFSIEELKSDFPNYEIIEITEKVIQLNEGLYHNGLGSVVRFIGRKLV